MAKIMKNDFKLTQLYKTKQPNYMMGTCMLHDDRFECEIKGDENLKNQLWQFVRGNWDGLTCRVEFDDIQNGLPKNGIITSIKGFSPILI